jgi:hypothetical protein
MEGLCVATVARMGLVKNFPLIFIINSFLLQLVKNKHAPIVSTTL